MKKLLTVGVCALLLVVLTGCGGKKVTCTGSYSEGGINVKAEVTANLDADDKITDVALVYTFDDKETATSYCSLIKLMEDPDKGITVDCSGSKITVKGMAGLDNDDSMVGKTKDDFVKMAEAESFTCK